MNVRLIAVTQPVPFEGGPTTPDELIVYVARVSNPDNQSNFDTAPKLLRYCLRQGHVSVFEQAGMTVEIETSRAISAQILRHRSFTFQEFSQRYATATDYEVYEARSQDTKNRQNAIDDMGAVDKSIFREMQTQVGDYAMWTYQQALKMGVAKECARFLLPMSTKTRLYMSGSCRSFIHYLEARLDPSTQEEHRDVALEIQKIFKQVFPSVAAAMEET